MTMRSKQVVDEGQQIAKQLGETFPWQSPPGPLAVENRSGVDRASGSSRARVFVWPMRCAVGVVPGHAALPGQDIARGHQSKCSDDPLPTERVEGLANILRIVAGDLTMEEIKGATE